MGLVQTCQVFDSKWKWSAVLAGGGYVRVARVFEEEDGAWGSGEGRGEDGDLGN